MKRFTVGGSKADPTFRPGAERFGEQAVASAEAVGSGAACRSDEELMLDLRHGGDAGSVLFERYRDPVWRFFRRRVADPARAEELAQDVFTAVLEAAPRYQARGRFRSYLFGIAYNVLMADSRKTPAANLFDTDVDPAVRATDPDEAIWVKRALAQLDPIDREVLMLREYEQLSYQEIAEVQQVPVNTVRSRLFRARLALREALLVGPTFRSGALQKEEAR